MTPREPVALGWLSAEAGFALDDLQVLAFGVLLDGLGSDWHRGVACTMGWLRGGRGPVTSRDEQPVTRALADAERWAAVWVNTDDLKPPLPSICERLGVTHWQPEAITPLRARGVEAVLHWLLANPLEQRGPPMRVPERDADGSVATVDELYRRAVAATPYARLTPEERRALRNRAELDEIRSRRLAALVADTLRRAVELASAS